MTLTWLLIFFHLIIKTTCAANCWFSSTFVCFLYPRPLIWLDRRATFQSMHSRPHMPRTCTLRWKLECCFSFLSEQSWSLCNVVLAARRTITVSCTLNCGLRHRLDLCLQALKFLSLFAATKEGYSDFCNWIN